MVFDQNSSQVLKKSPCGGHIVQMNFLNTILENQEVYQSEGSHVFVQASLGETLSFSKNNEDSGSIERDEHCSMSIISLKQTC